MRRVLFCVPLLTAGLVLCCPAMAEEVADPLEGLNRKIQSFNDGADRMILKPVAKGYRAVLPNPVRRSVGNFFSNIMQPVTIVNQFLQGKGGDGGRDTMRFLVNTTLGVGGLFDVATKVGLQEHQEDFDQTFARWGIGSGPYLVLPLFGPSTLRGGVGTLANVTVTPLRYLDDESVRNTLTAVYFIDGRANLLDIEELIGGDRYTFLRDAYLQRRAFLINDGVAEDDPFLDEDFDDTEEEDEVEPVE